MNNFDIDTVMAELEKHFTRVRTPVVDQIQIQTKDPFKVLVTTIIVQEQKMRPLLKQQRSYLRR